MPMPDYYESGGSKVGDFFIGVGIYLGIYLVFQGLSSLMGVLLGSKLGSFNFNFILPLGVLSLAGLVLAPVISFILYKKYFLERKYVKYGMITLLVMELTPVVLFLLLLGYCMINPPNW